MEDAEEMLNNLGMDEKVEKMDVEAKKTKRIKKLRKHKKQIKANGKTRQIK